METSLKTILRIQLLLVEKIIKNQLLCTIFLSIPIVLEALHGILKVRIKVLSYLPVREITYLKTFVQTMECLWDLQKI